VAADGWYGGQRVTSFHSVCWFVKADHKRIPLVRKGMTVTLTGLWLSRETTDAQGQKRTYEDFVVRGNGGLEVITKVKESPQAGGQPQQTQAPAQYQQPQQQAPTQAPPQQAYTAQPVRQPAQQPAYQQQQPVQQAPPPQEAQAPPQTVGQTPGQMPQTELNVPSGTPPGGFTQAPNPYV
jgi:single-stranded DNA-binding protein